MSSLTYNQVVLDPYIRTREIDIDLVMDPSGVDPLYQHITIHVQCLLNRARLGVAPSQWLASNFPRLTAPRKELKFVVGTSTMLSSDTTKDVKNGPIPKGPKIIEIDSDQSMMMLFTVETWQHVCPDGSTASKILSHRWRENVSMDEDFYTTWTRTGTVVFTSQVEQPDDMRGTFYPPIVLGFKRIRSDWTIDEAGTGYSYVIEDREQYLNPPPPATYADGEYSVSSANNAQVFAECSVTLRGSKTTPKSKLIEIATKIALDKFKGAVRKPIPVGGSIKEKLWKNEVSVMMRARWAPAKGQIIGGLALASYGLGLLPPGVSPQTAAPDAGPFGTSGVQIIKAKIEDWCKQTSSFKTIGTGGTQQGGSVEGSTVTLRTGTPTEQSPGAGDYNDTSTIYVTYTITKTYEKSLGILHLPVASSTVQDVSAIVQIAAPMRDLVVDYKVEGIGAEPTIPSTTPLNDSVVIQSETFTPFEPGVEPDGTTLRFAATGTVVYAFKTTDAVAINAGVPPWIKGVQTGQIKYQTKQKNIIGLEA